MDCYTDNANFQNMAYDNPSFSSNNQGYTIDDMEFSDQNDTSPAVFDNGYNNDNMLNGFESTANPSSQYAQPQAWGGVQNPNSGDISLDVANGHNSSFVTATMDPNMNGFNPVVNNGFVDPTLLSLNNNMGVNFPAMNQGFNTFDPLAIGNNTNFQFNDQDVMYANPLQGQVIVAGLAQMPQYTFNATSNLNTDYPALDNFNGGTTSNPAAPMGDTPTSKPSPVIDLTLSPSPSPPPPSTTVAGPAKRGRKRKADTESVAGGQAKTPNAKRAKLKQYSCNLCRKKKVKCNGQVGQACSMCVKHGKECVIDGQDGRTKRTNLEEFLVKLEKKNLLVMECLEVARKAAYSEGLFGIFKTCWKPNSTATTVLQILMASLPESERVHYEAEMLRIFHHYPTGGMAPLVEQVRTMASQQLKVKDLRPLKDELKKIARWSLAAAYQSLDAFSQLDYAEISEEKLRCHEYFAHYKVEDMTLGSESDAASKNCLRQRGTLDPTYLKGLMGDGGWEVKRSILQMAAPPAPPPAPKITPDVPFSSDAPAAEVDNLQPQGFQHEIHQPEVLQPEVLQPEVLQPEAYQPEVLQPEGLQYSPVEVRLLEALAPGELPAESGEQSTLPAEAPKAEAGQQTNEESHDPTTELDPAGAIGAGGSAASDFSQDLDPEVLSVFREAIEPQHREESLEVDIEKEVEGFW